jgi:hypothetical protein
MWDTFCNFQVTTKSKQSPIWANNLVTLLNIDLCLAESFA